MKKFVYLIFFSLASLLILNGCKSKPDDPLIIPPNFSEVPDPNHPEDLSKEQKEQSASRLREILLNSDE